MAGPAVLDNTVLVNFATAERPRLLTQVWPEAICTTPAVKREYEEGVAQGAVPNSTWNALRVCELSGEEVEFATQLSARLGAGERSCLAVAYYRGGLFVSDDADARREARRHEIPVTGTLGILARAVEENTISLEEGNRLLARMIDAGYHAPVERLYDLL